MIKTFKTFVASIFFIPLIAFGQVANEARLPNPVARIAEPKNLIDLLVTIFQLLGGPIVVIGLIYSGYLLVSAQGDEGKLEDGRRALLWTIVGGAIILGASVIKAVVMGTINGLK